MTPSDPAAIVVQGSGIVGMTLALSLARLGLRVDWTPPLPRARPAPEDVRTYALNAASVALLRELKVWEALPPHRATAVCDMVVHGDRAGSALRFSAWEQGVDELAWIVDAAALEDTLRRAMSFAALVCALPAEGGRAPDPEGRVLVAYCEGKASSARQALGVRFDRLDYGQRAVATRLVADRSHDGRAWQWFRSPDVLALLPFDRPEAGRSYGLVWSLPVGEAERLLHAPSSEFEQALAQATGGDAGVLMLGAPRMAWPLGIARADRWCGPGWVLLGDAAHVVHPLAGQGLNLGLADVAELTRVLARREPWRPVGDARLLRRYERARAGPTRAMGRLTDALLHLFASDVGPLGPLRNRGLDLVDHSGPLKRWLVSRALGA